MVSFYRVPVSTPKTTATPTHCLLTPPALLMAGHPKGNPTAVVRAGLSSLPLPFSGTCTLLDHGLQKHPATLLHQCQAPCVCWVTDHSQTELRAAPSRVSLCRCSHTIIGCSDSLFHLPEEADPISRVFWMGKSTAYSQSAQAGRQQQQQKTWTGVVFFFGCKTLPMRHGFWDVWCPDSLVAFPPAHLQSSRQGGETTWGHTQALGWLSGSWGSHTQHKHTPAAWPGNITPCQTAQDLCTPCCQSWIG